MTSAFNKDSERLEKLYTDICSGNAQELTESIPPSKSSDEGDEVDAAIELTNKKDELKKKGAKVPASLQPVFQKADKKLRTVAKKLSD